MRAVDAIVERKIAEARENGYFDNLPGAGKPIADLDVQRPAGWWGERFAKQERHQMLRDELARSIRQGIPAMQRATGADQADRVADLNARIDGYNRITTVAPLPRLEASTVWQP